MCGNFLLSILVGINYYNSANKQKLQLKKQNDRYSVSQSLTILDACSESCVLVDVKTLSGGGPFYPI